MQPNFILVLSKKKSMVWTRFCPPNLDAKVWNTLRLPTLKVGIQFESLDNASFWLPHILTISYGSVFALYFIQSMSQSFSWSNHERNIMFSFNLGKIFCCPSQEFILHQIKVTTCLYKLNLNKKFKSFTFLGSQIYMSMKYFLAFATSCVGYMVNPMNVCLSMVHLCTILVPNHIRSPSCFGLWNLTWFS
jgi:hypothetical protein